MTAKRKIRFRWRQTVTLVIGTYLAYWCVVSLHHMVVIGQQQQTLYHQIAVVRAQNRVLTNDIRTLHNPAKLKQILTGQVPLPNPNGQP